MSAASSRLFNQKQADMRDVVNYDKYYAFMTDVGPLLLCLKGRSA